MTHPAPLTAQDQAAHELRRRILGGDYSPGTRLPAERKLAEELDISRLTLRGALSTLASEGLVRSHPGSGIEVLDWKERGAPDVFQWVLATAEADEQPGVVAGLFAQVIQLRRTFVLDVLVRAAERATPQDLADLRALAREQEDRVDDPEAYLLGDEQYQQRVLGIADRPLVQLLFNSLRRATWRRPELILSFMGPLREHLQTYEMVHALLEAEDEAVTREQAERTLDFVEASGLRRVRLHLHGAQDEEPAVDPAPPSPFSDPRPQPRPTPRRASVATGTLGAGAGARPLRSGGVSAR